MQPRRPSLDYIVASRSLSFMKLACMAGVACGLLVLAGCGANLSTADQATSSYPPTTRGEVVDDYFGVSVADPYRWLEELDGAETKAWVEAQNAYSRPALEALPDRARLIERLTELWDHERFGVPSREGGLYFFTHNDGLQNQSVIKVAESLDGEPRVLIDPNGFSEDGTVALAGFSVSPDGRYAAYARSDGGSDWRDWYIREIASGEDLPTVVTHTKFTTPSWTRDSAGFYYSRYPLTDGKADDSKAVEIYYHALGTSQEQDRHIYSIPEYSERNPAATVSEDGRFLIITVSEGNVYNAVYYVASSSGTGLVSPEAPVVKLLDEWDARYSFLGNVGNELFFRTTLDAPRERVIAIDVGGSGAATDKAQNLREVIAQRDEALQSASIVGKHFVARYLRDVQPLVHVHELDGELLRAVELPGLGSVAGFSGDQSHSETFYSFTGFTTPATIYRYDTTSGESTLFKQPQVSVDADAYETSQVFYESRDGTRVPMFLTHKKGLEKNGQNMTLLYGYGGFNISLTPGFSVARMVWLEQGGVLAIPNLRGGGEYGKEWHLAGTRERKQNVFDDFLAAAEWLIDNGYTSTPKLAIQGASNGGLLVGAAMNQRPELFGAVLPAVGVMDMLRYHLPSANARNWKTDYGLSENEADFRAQIAYSPLHNLESGTCYPPTLVTTADHDDRVVPWHSFKYGATLQHAQGCDNPILISVETRAGHGAGKPTWMRIEEIADMWAFLLHHLAS